MMTKPSMHGCTRKQKYCVHCKAGNQSINQSNKKAVLSQRWPRDACYISWPNEPLRRYGHSRILGAYGTPFWGRGGRRAVGGQRRHHSTERWWFLIGSPLWVVTVALSVTIRPQFAIECLRRSNQEGVGQFGPKFPDVPLGVVPGCLGLQRANIPG